MNNLFKSLPTYLFIFSLLPTITFLGINIKNSSQLLMPKEYKIIKKIINKLALKNDLGEYPLTFTIVAGSKTYWIGKSLGICVEGDSCYFIRNINPFVPYKGRLSEELNEAIRQSYLLNTIEAYAWANGTIAISRSSFKNNENKEDYLAFVIGHEISHVLNEDSFNNSLKVSKQGKRLKTKKKMELGFEISRESEREADICSAKMLINAGYSTSIPIKAHDFIAKKYGYGYETGKKCSHPGYEERRNNLIDFIYKNYPDSSNIKGCTKGSWSYDRKENTLTYKIKERYLPPQLNNLKAASNLAKAFEGDLIESKSTKE